jgi:hypothetical protein
LVGWSLGLPVWVGFGGCVGFVGSLPLLPVPWLPLLPSLAPGPVGWVLGPCVGRAGWVGWVGCAGFDGWATSVLPWWALAGSDAQKASTRSSPPAAVTSRWAGRVWWDVPWSDFLPWA